MDLIVENLTKSYKDNVVLKDVNFTFDSGKIYGLIGRNGAGITTFFNSIKLFLTFLYVLFYLL